MPTIALDGVDLHYEERGSGPPVLLIHGNGGVAELWDEIRDGLAPDHRVIVPDRRSFRRSQADFPKDIRVHADDMAALLEALDAAPATVVGWSAGGVIALHLAAKRPDVISSLVLLEPAAIARRPSAGLLRAFVTWEMQRMRGKQEKGALTFFRWASRYTDGGNAFDAYPEHIRRAMLDTAPAIFREARAGAGGEKLKAGEVAGIALPTTILCGDRSDPAFPRGSRWVADRIPGATIVPVPGSHMVATDAPQEVVTAVRAATATAAPSPAPA
jgi:pimeloyl-ACP methyl ester carboxylesterase